MLIHVKEISRRYSLWTGRHEVRTVLPPDALLREFSQKASVVCVSLQQGGDGREI